MLLAIEQLIRDISLYINFCVLVFKFFFLHWTSNDSRDGGGGVILPGLREDVSTRLLVSTVQRERPAVIFQSCRRGLVCDGLCTSASLSPASGTHHPGCPHTGRPVCYDWSLQRCDCFFPWKAIWLIHFGLTYYHQLHHQSELIIFCWFCNSLGQILLMTMFWTYIDIMLAPKKTFWYGWLLIRIDKWHFCTFLLRWMFGVHRQSRGLWDTTKPMLAYQIAGASVLASLPPTQFILL